MEVAASNQRSDFDGDSVIIRPVSDPEEEKTDFAVSICGAYYLEVADSLIVGPLLNGSTQQSKDEVTMDTLRDLVAALRPDQPAEAKGKEPDGN